MNNRFLFYKLRSSAASDNQAVLQLYCNERAVPVHGLEAFYTWDDEVHDVEICIMNHAIDAESGIRRYRDDLSHILTIVITVPTEMPDAAELIVSEPGGEHDRKIIYTCSGTRLKTCIGRLNYGIDSVAKEKGKLVIRGWAVDHDKVNFGITGRRYMKDVDFEYSCEWMGRQDIAACFPEYGSDKPIGFCISLKNKKIGMNMLLSTSSKSGAYRLRGITKYSRFAFVNRLKRYVHRGFFSLNQNGFSATADKVRKRLFRKSTGRVTDYGEWLREHAPKDRELDSQRVRTSLDKPLFSVILLPCMRDSSFYWSITKQTCPLWELREAESVSEAVLSAKGDYIIFGRMDDVLMPNALYECEQHIIESKPDIIYSDEDYFDRENNVCCNPNFKPDFNIDLLRSCNYIHHTLAVSAKLLRLLKPSDVDSIYENEYDFIFKCVDRTDKILHIPKLLYRNLCGSLNESVDGVTGTDEAEELRRKDMLAIEGHLDRCGIEASVCPGGAKGIYTVSYAVQDDPLVSIIIPNKDHVSDLKRCIESIDNISDYRNYEFIIVENNSTEQSVFDYYREISERDNVQVLYYKGGFNYSAINNYGAEAARGEYILLLNNDTQLIDGDCISQMLGCCQREDVGIVGAKLYYEDGTIQHGGVIIGLGGIAGHAFAGCDESEGLYQSRTHALCDYNAVTAACLMVRKSVFEAAGGLDEAFGIAFNDIDFCLKVRRLGGLVVYNPNAILYHYESKTRGSEDTPEKQERFQDEIELFCEKWNDILRRGDSYYNPNLTLELSDFSLLKG